MSRPRTSYLRACKLLALAAVGVAATLAAPGAALADASCAVRHSGSPTVLGDLTRIPADGPYSIDVVCTGGVPNPSPNTFSVDAAPTHGTLTEQAPGSPTFTYTPTTGYVGTDSFIITPQNNLGPTRRTSHRSWSRSSWATTRPSARARPPIRCCTAVRCRRRTPARTPTETRSPCRSSRSRHTARPRSPRRARPAESSPTPLP